MQELNSMQIANVVGGNNLGCFCVSTYVRTHVNSPEECKNFCCNNIIELGYGIFSVGNEDVESVDIVKVNHYAYLCPSSKVDEPYVDINFLSQEI